MEQHESTRLAHLRFVADKEYLGKKGDHYALIGVQPTASITDIEEAYSRVLKRLTRAKRELGGRAGLGEVVAAIRRMLSCALLILEDPLRRAEYDQQLWTRDVSQPALPRRYATTRALHAARARMRGCAHFMRHEYLLAELLFRRAVRLEPRNAMYHLELGWTILQNVRRDTSARLQHAREHLEFARIHAPHEPRARYCMAMYYKEQGCRRSCRRELEAALRCDPDYGPARAEFDLLLRSERPGRKHKARLNAFARLLDPN